MSDNVIEQLVRSEKVIIPYEDVRGEKQVSTIISSRDGRYDAFDPFDDDRKYLRPVGLRRSQLSSEQLEDFISKKGVCYEVIVLKVIHVIRADFLLDEMHVSVIEGIDFFGADEASLKLRREGAAYPYGLLLKTTPGNVTRGIGTTQFLGGARDWLNGQLGPGFLEVWTMMLLIMPRKNTKYANVVRIKAHLFNMISIAALATTISGCGTEGPNLNKLYSRNLILEHVEKYELEKILNSIAMDSGISQKSIRKDVDGNDMFLYSSRSVTIFVRRKFDEACGELGCAWKVDVSPSDTALSRVSQKELVDAAFTSISGAEYIQSHLNIKNQ